MRPTPQALSEDDKKQLDRLSDEYRILQDKIDKIGGFGFTIKGWSITLVIGALLAGTATKSVPPLLWMTALVLFLGAFFLMEKRQSDLSYKFRMRVLEIEEVSSRVMRSSVSDALRRELTSLRYVPGIGHHLAPKRRRESRSSSPTPAERAPKKEGEPGAGEPSPSPLSGNTNESAPELPIKVPSRKRQSRTWWESAWDADIHFYALQGALVIAAFIAVTYFGTRDPDPQRGVTVINSVVPEPVLSKQDKSDGKNQSAIKIGASYPRGKEGKNAKKPR